MINYHFVVTTKNNAATIYVCVSNADAKRVAKKLKVRGDDFDNLDIYEGALPSEILKMNIEYETKATMPELYKTY